MISSKFIVEQFYAHSFIKAVVIADVRAHGDRLDPRSYQERMGEASLDRCHDLNV